MANISAYITSIEAATRGEEVRDSIVNALNAINSDVNEAMKASVYDADEDGVVDNAEKVNSHTVDSDVPSNAVFTDTTYNPASESADGLMSSTDKSKLDSVPTPTSNDSGKYLRVDSTGAWVLATVSSAEGVSF